MSEATPAGPIRKVEPEKIRLAHEYKLARPLTACFWEPQNRFVLLGAEDSGILRFDLQSHEAIPMVGPHDSWVRAIGTSPDGQVTFSGGYDGRLIWWPTDAEKPVPIRVVDAHEGWIRALAVSPDGSRVATCGNDHLVRLWDVRSGALLHTWEGHQSHVYNVAFSPAGDSLVSCDLKGFVKLWDPGPSAATADGERTSSETEAGPPSAAKPAVSDGAVEAPDDGAVDVPGAARDLAHLKSLHHYDNTFRADIGGARCMAYSDDGTRLAIGGVTNVTNAFAGVGDAVVALVDTADGKLVVQYAPTKKLRGTTWGIAPHPEDFWIGLAAGGGGGWFYFWRGEEAGEFFKFKLKHDGRGMSLSPDATQLAVAHADRHLRIYALFEEAPSSETQGT